MTDITAPAPGSVTESTANIALRLGWMVAEFAGRLRPDAPPYGADKSRNGGWTLPLGAADERSATELQIESAKVLAAVAGKAGVDITIDDLTDQRSVDYPNTSPPAVSRAICYLVMRLLYARDQKDDLHATLGLPEFTTDELNQPPNPDVVWKKIQDLLWVWDEAIQDKLGAEDFGTSSAYQLGRGLAETYWALDPDAQDGDPRSWGYLLGENRVTALTILCRRLSSSIGKITAPAVEASLAVWQEVAAAPGDYIEPRAKLGDQLLVWRDLLLAQRDPISIVPKDQLEKDARSVLPLLNAFKGELAVGAGAAAALGVSTYYLPHIGGSIGAVLSAFGITAAAIGSRAKATMQSVGDRVRDTLSQDAVNGAAIKRPNKITTSRFLGVGTKQLPAEEIVPALRP
jgi:hypothetical protein